MVRRKRMEVEEKGQKLGENGRKLLGKMFVKMGREEWELEEKGVKNWEMKGLEEERKLLGDGSLYDTLIFL